MSRKDVTLSGSVPRVTALPAADLEGFFQLLPRIYADYHDPRRGPFKMAYMYANTPDNEDSMFLRAIELANAGAIESLGTSEGDLGYGYEGFDHSVARLKALGWKDKVPLVKLDVGGNVNTGSEAQKLAEYLLNYDSGLWMKTDLAIIAPPFHLPRAFMTTVTALHRADLKMRVYPICGVPLPWNEEAVHSQGTLKKKRADLLDSELQRLEKYRAAEFGSMLPPSEVLKYLDWRDG